MVVLCAATEDVGASNGFSLGSIHFRRLVIRWEYHVENFFGMVRLGCMQILFRYL
jgi:hypothetical protein